MQRKYLENLNVSWLSKIIEISSSCPVFSQLMAVFYLALLVLIMLWWVKFILDTNHLFYIYFLQHNSLSLNLFPDYIIFIIISIYFVSLPLDSYLKLQIQSRYTIHTISPKSHVCFCIATHCKKFAKLLGHTVALTYYMVVVLLYGTQ